MRPFIVIAALNEEKRIGKVLSELKKKGYYDIVVVDDGSSDKTFMIAEASGVYALKHAFNRGQGAALRTGIDFALMRKADLIVTYDADGQFLVDEIKTITWPVINKEADIALGSRFKGKAINIPFLKKMILKLGTVVVFLLYGIKITDSQCGFRAMTKDAAEKIEITSDRMEHAGEIFYEIMRNKLKYTEVPVTVIYDSYALKKGQSWSNSFELGTRMLFKRLLR